MTRPLRRTATLAAAFLALPGAGALANPSGGTVAAGTVAITAPNATTLVVTQTSQNAIVNWDSFFVDSNETVNFVQPGATSAILNRVNAGNFSSIYGQLHANGRVILISPAGLYFDGGASIDVGSLVASTLDISDADFLAGRYHFTRAPGAGFAQVYNAGYVHAGSGGHIVFIGDFAGNDGTLDATLGTIALGAGGEALMTIGANGLVDLQIGADAVVGTVDDGLGAYNGGALLADGGRIVVDAHLAQGLARNAVNLLGSVHATSIQGAGGELILRATGEDAFLGYADIQASTLDASTEGAGLVVLNAGIAADDARFATRGTDTLMSLESFGLTVNHSLVVDAGFELDINSAGIQGLNGATLSFSSGRNFSVADTDISGGDITLRAGYPDVGNLAMLGYVGIHGRNVVIDSNFAIRDNVYDNPGSFSTYIDADSLVMHAEFSITLPETQIHVGSGAASYAHDSALVAALAAARPDLAPPSRAPNAIFDTPLFIDLGTLQVDGGYAYVRADGLRLFGAVTGPSNLLLQFTPNNPTLNVGIENEFFFRTVSFPVHDDQYGQLANLQAGATFAVGSGGYFGGLAIGEYLPPDLTGHPLNFAFMTYGQVAGLSTITTDGSVLLLRGQPVDVLPPDGYTILDVIFQTASLQSLSFAYAEGFEASVYGAGDTGTFSYQFQARGLGTQAQDEGISYVNHRAEYGAPTSSFSALECR